MDHKSKKHPGLGVLLASLGRLELPLLAPEASALSTELQGRT